MGGEGKARGQAWPWEKSRQMPHTCSQWGGRPLLPGSLLSHLSWARLGIMRRAPSLSRKGRVAGEFRVSVVMSLETRLRASLRPVCLSQGTGVLSDEIKAVSRARHTISSSSHLLAFSWGGGRCLPATGAFLQPDLLLPYLKTKTKAKPKPFPKPFLPQGQTTLSPRARQDTGAGGFWESPHGVW